MILLTFLFSQKSPGLEKGKGFEVPSASRYADLVNEFLKITNY